MNPIEILEKIDPKKVPKVPFQHKTNLRQN